MSRFVLDNTVTMAWCFSDEATEFTKTLLNRLSNLTDRAVVPALWLYEVANVVELAVRKRRLTGQSPPSFVGLLNLAEAGNDLGKAIAEPVKETASGVFSKIATEHLEDMLSGVQRLDQTRQVRVCGGRWRQCSWRWDKVTWMRERLMVLAL